MSRTHLKAAIIGGLIVFIWGMFSWMVFPWHQSCLKKFTNESDVADAIKDNAPVAGVYVLPNTFAYKEGTSEHEMSKGIKMMENGPFMFATVRPHGVGAMSLKPFILSLIIQIIGAFIVTWMVMQTKGLSYKKQVGFITLFGLGVGVLSQLPDWNWWGFSGAYVLTYMADLIISWFLAGLGIAKVLKKKA
jgi:predicted small secreted protein